MTSFNDDLKYLCSKLKKKFPKIENNIIEDALQDALLSFYAKEMHLIIKSETHRKNWLFHAAKWKLYNDLRKFKKYEFIPIESIGERTPVSTKSKPSYDIETLKLLKENIKLLNSEERKILSLFYFKKKTSGEIAQLIDCKEATVRKRKERAIAKLRTLFAKGRD